MKVAAENIVEFLDQVKALVEGITDIIRMGDDGMEECVVDQVETISKVIEVFKLEQLTAVTPVDPASKKYGKIYEQLSEKEDPSTGEIMALYKSELYFAVKRVVKENTAIADIPNNELANFIEGIIPDNSKYRKLIYSDQFFYASIHVIQEVADEIIEARRKAPQQKLF